MVEDESDYFQYGQFDEMDFYTFVSSAPQPTSWTDFPTEDEPYNLFKYSSFEIELNQDAVIWQRQIYSTLDFLGDLGGLFDALRFIGEMIVSPFKDYAVKVILMVSLFR